MLAVPDQTEDAGGFSSRKDISEIAVRGPSPRIMFYEPKTSR